MIQKVISIGRDGIGLVALEVADSLSINTGGYFGYGYSVSEVTKKKYHLIERNTRDSATRLCVKECHGVLSINPSGSEQVSRYPTLKQLSAELDKPILSTLSKPDFIQWVDKNDIQILFIDGVRYFDSDFQQQLVRVALTNLLS